MNGLNATSNGYASLINTTRLFRDPEQEWIAFFDNIYSLVEEHPEINTIILFARWGIYANGTRYRSESGEDLFLQYQGQQAQNQEQNRIFFEKSFRDTLASLAKLERDIILIGPVPEIGIDVPNAMAKARLHGQQVSINPSYQDFWTETHRH